MTENIKNSVQKLEDNLLDVSGGEFAKGVAITGLVVTGVSVLSGIGCGIASVACQYKAKNRRAQGDIQKAKKYEKAARILGATSLGVGVGGTVVGLLIGGCAFEAHRRVG